jgi:hypothetical protein
MVMPEVQRPRSYFEQPGEVTPSAQPQGVGEETIRDATMQASTLGQAINAGENDEIETTV